MWSWIFQNPDLVCYHTISVFFTIHYKISPMWAILAMGRWRAIEPFLFSLYRNTKTRREPYSSREGPSQSLVVMKLSLLFMAILAFPSITLSMSLSGNESPADNEAYWLDLLNQNRFEKRKFAANDPRSLFASVYANYKLVNFCNFFIFASILYISWKLRPVVF